MFVETKVCISQIKETSSGHEFCFSQINNILRFLFNDACRTFKLGKMFFSIILIIQDENEFYCNINFVYTRCYKTNKSEIKNNSNIKRKAQW